MAGRTIVAVLAHAAVGWALCFATIGIGMAVTFVAIVDFLVVAMVILRSLEMFGSPLGTWIPFMLIFLSTWLIGHAVVARRAGRRGARPPAAGRSGAVGGHHVPAHRA